MLRTPPIFSWQTRKLSATNQQWSLWLYTKHLMDMFSSFWIRRPLTFEKYPIFHPTRGFSANNLGMLHCLFFQDLKGHKLLDTCDKFLVSWIILTLLFKFKIGPSLSLSCLMLSMFIIMWVIIRIIKKMCLENTILMAGLKEKLP